MQQQLLLYANLATHFLVIICFLSCNTQKNELKQSIKILVLFKKKLRVKNYCQVKENKSCFANRCFLIRRKKHDRLIQLPRKISIPLEILLYENLATHSLVCIYFLLCKIQKNKPQPIKLVPCSLGRSLLQIILKSNLFLKD